MDDCLPVIIFVVFVTGDRRFEFSRSQTIDKNVEFYEKKTNLCFAFKFDEYTDIICVRLFPKASI